MRKLGLAFAILGLMGCADDPNSRLKVGDRVMLIGGGPDSDIVSIKDLPPHQPVSATGNVSLLIHGTADEEIVLQGMMANVVSDIEKNDSAVRPVKVRFADGPLKDLTGTVGRFELKKQ